MRKMLVLENGCFGAGNPLFSGIPKQLVPVFCRGFPIFPQECPVKDRIIQKSIGGAGVTYAHAVYDCIPAHGKPFFQNVLVQGVAHVFRKDMGNVVFADIEFLGQHI